MGFSTEYKWESELSISISHAFCFLPMDAILPAALALLPWLPHHGDYTLRLWAQMNLSFLMLSGILLQQQEK